MKKVVIIGGGISGLTTGIYLLDNGFDVEIYEKHSLPGGQCTGWYRQGYFIDGCAHWLVGTSTSSDLHPIYRHIGAIDDHSVIYDTEYFGKYYIDDQEITFYADLDKLEKELIRISKEDTKQIKKLIKSISVYQSVKIPVSKPLDMMNLFELIKFGFPMLRMLTSMLKYKHMSLEDYGNRFKSPILRKLFCRLMDNKEYNVHSMLYTMQAMSKKDAGIIEGGSLKLIMRVKENFTNKGGKLFLNSPVKKIIVENDIAKGILLESGKEIYSDYVISCADLNHTINSLLEGKYYDKDLTTKIKQDKNYLLHTCLYASFGVKKDISKYPKNGCYEIEELDILDQKENILFVRNYSFDKTLNKDKTTLTSIINLDDKIYDDLKNMTKEEYQSFKEKLAKDLLERIKKIYSLSDEEVVFLDIATPLTYERYNNSYKGSYMSFITTKRSKGLMRKGLVKGLKNFALAGQWIMPPGGIPIALFTSKNTAYRVSKKLNHKWICKD